MFCPRIGLSLQTEPSPLYPLLSLPFRIFIQSIYRKVAYHLIFSPANFLPFTIPSRAFFSWQFLLSQWPNQFLFLFFISSCIILPSPTISRTTAFFILSVHFTCYILLHIHISNVSNRFWSFRVVSKSLHQGSQQSWKRVLGKQSNSPCITGLGGEGGIIVDTSEWRIHVDCRFW